MRASSRWAAMSCAEHFLWLRMLMKFVSACWDISGELTSTEISPALCGSTFAASHARLSICGLLSGKSYCFLRCRVLHTPACLQGSLQPGCGPYIDARLHKDEQGIWHLISVLIG